MTEFNEGWWNCFISFANELALSDRSSDLEINTVLRGAGITSDEIIYVLEIYGYLLEKSVKTILLNYKENNGARNRTR